MSPAPEWREEPITRHHDRASFDCGSPELNTYLARYARQNHESGGAKTFVAVPPSTPTRILVDVLTHDQRLAIVRGYAATAGFT